MAADDDFPNLPPDQGFPADLDSSSGFSGNRPASGARRATPGEVLSQGFLGAQNAGDFLGLDEEFTGQDPNFGSPLDLVPPPSSGDPSLYPDEAVAPAPLPDSDPVQEFAEAPSAFEFGEDLGSDEGVLPADLEPRSGGRKGLFVGALAVAAIAAGGVFYGPDLYDRYFGAGTKVAELPRPPASQPRPKAPDSPVAPKNAPVTATGETPTLDPDGKLGPLDPGTTEPTPPSLVSRGFGDDGEPETDLPLDPEPQTFDPVVSDANPALGAAPGGGEAAQGEFPDLAGHEYAWASVDRLELIWRGSEVPIAAVSAPAKTLMPKVGTVRVFTTTGDVFEGRLYAVGQNRVWIDAEPGRIGLDGDKVERIEVLPPQPEGQSANDTMVATGGKHVRVRVPGGMLAGRVLKTDGDEVTLALDDGGRVRVKAADVEDLGSGRAIVVRR